MGAGAFSDYNRKVSVLASSVVSVVQPMFPKTRPAKNLSDHLFFTFCHKILSI